MLVACRYAGEGQGLRAEEVVSRPQDQRLVGGAQLDGADVLEPYVEVIEVGVTGSGVQEKLRVSHAVAPPTEVPVEHDRIREPIISRRQPGVSVVVTAARPPIDVAGRRVAR